MRMNWTRPLAGAALAISAAVTGGAAAWAFGEAGPLNLSRMGHFYVGIDVGEPGPNGAVTVSNQSYVGFAVPAEVEYPNPLILIHGGGGQSVDWFSTVDGRDGWRNYFLAAGLETYWIDRPGYGRSPANPSYGDLGQASSAIIARLATSENWPGDASNPQDPGVINWLAGAPGTPYAGNDMAARNIAEVARRVGPAVLFGHSAGVASTIDAALDAPEAVRGVLIFEGGVDLLADERRAAATWEPALGDDFEPIEVEGCRLQPEGGVSRNVTLADIPFTIIRTEHGNGSDEAFACAVRQLEQMGVDAKFVQLADIGFAGGGHFMMSDTNNGEIAEQVLLPVLGDLMGEDPLPASWTIVD